MHWQTIQVDSDWILSRPMTQFYPFTLAWKHVKRHHYPCDRGLKMWKDTLTVWTGLENMYKHPWQCELGLKTCHEHIFVERFETVCQQPGVLLDITSMTMWQGLEILHIQPWRCEGGLKTCKRIHDSVTGAWKPCHLNKIMAEKLESGCLWPGSFNVKTAVTMWTGLQQ